MVVAGRASDPRRQSYGRDVDAPCGSPVRIVVVRIDVDHDVGESRDLIEQGMVDVEGDQITVPAGFQQVDKAG